INSLENLRAFLCVARHGSFSKAARELHIVTSAITRRVEQLESALGTRLLERSTRGLTLTGSAEALLPKFSRIVAEIDDLLRNGGGPQDGIEGLLRVKAPTTVTSEFIGALIVDFIRQHPGVNVDITLADYSVNPLEQGFDVALGAMPVTYPDVVDIPLWRYDLVACCAPDYLQGRAPPRHPSDLADHVCLTTTLFRGGWLFESGAGSVDIDVPSRIHVSDGRVVREAARRGVGIAALARYLVEEDLRRGRLVSVLEDFPFVTHWLKALVPRTSLARPAVQGLVEFLKEQLREGPKPVQ
ncbi:MAG TPA: LysR family transcriptional regulator, partial [Steroidobacteraceae bacterium]